MASWFFWFTLVVIKYKRLFQSFRALVYAGSNIIHGNMISHNGKQLFAELVILYKGLFWSPYTLSNTLKGELKNNTVKGEFVVGFSVAYSTGHFLCAPFMQCILGILIYKFCQVKNNYILIKLSNAISFNNIQN